MITQAQARNEIFALFKAAWDSGTPVITSYIPKIEYQGVQPASIPDTTKHWCRISIQNVSEGQASLSNSVGKQKFTAYGLIFVQIFSPRSENNGFQKGLLLGQVGKKAFRGKKTVGGIWFRNVRLAELDPEDSFHRLNVIAEYEYDELG